MNDENQNEEQESNLPVADEPPPRQSSYLEKIVKYVPAAIIAAYVAGLGIIQEQPDNPIWLYWALFGSLLVLTPLYTVYLPEEKKEGVVHSMRYKVISSTLAYIVWAFALGGPFELAFDWYRPVFGSLLLIITTLTLPILEKVALQMSFFHDGRGST